jgi:lipopolysaccharide export system permease protein
MLIAELTRLFLATLGAVVLIYLVIDFADRGSMFHGEGWLLAVAELYADKAAVVALQLSPGALVIASALLIAQLDRRGELTALLALGVHPLRLCVPLALFALLLGAGMIALEEKVVVFADARAEEITAVQFHRWGDWGQWHGKQRWVRGKEGRFFLLGELRERGFEPATIFEIAEPFHLARRIDARRLEQTATGRWRLLGAVERRYGAESIDETRADELLIALPDQVDELALRSGRPRQLPWGDLVEQAKRRAALGQPDIEYRTAVVERAAQPLVPLPAALAAVGLTLRRRRGKVRPPPLAAALASSLVLVLALWSLAVIAHAAAIGGTLSPTPAGLLPLVASALLAALLLRD